MTDLVRTLNERGGERLREWISAARAGGTSDPPTWLLTSTEHSAEFQPDIAVAREPSGRPFNDRLEFGLYLAQLFADVPKTVISRQHNLWNWLSLYYIDQLAPSQANGARKLFEFDVYLLDSVFSFRKYYRHAVRTSWLVAAEHGQSGRVLLVPAGRTAAGVGVLAHRGEIIEQMAARQWTLGSRSIIQAAEKMYIDVAAGKPKRGAGGAGKGSPRRLAAVIQQLELTYDLRDCSAEQFLSLLPKEFDRWKLL
ncbi:MAG: hypothetical protein WC809_19605 [Sinimarinibacterium sp.]